MMGLGSGPPLADLAKVILAIPIAASYGVIGSVAGGAIGATAGAVAGTSLYNHFSK